MVRPSIASATVAVLCTTVLPAFKGYSKMLSAMGERSKKATPSAFGVR